MFYYRCLLATALAILVFAAGFNFIADPAGVYQQDRNRAHAIKYADALIQSEYGLWWLENSFEDREIKKALAKYSSHSECVVIGSSHVMQVGSARKTNSLVKECASILNLGVSGASIEDHFALVYLSLKSGHPKKIVLGIDPWTFTFGKDQRWAYYSEDYQQARQAVLGDRSLVGKNENNDTLRSKLRNLLSLEYTLRSVRKAAGGFKHESDRYTAKAAPNLEEMVGGEHPVLLRDGSMLYSAKYLVQVNTQPIPLGGTVYKTEGVLNDLDAINAYISLLRWIKKQRVEPILLLTPYHQNVWAAADSQNTRALKATEPIVRQLANDLGLTVVGSYNPDSASCLSSEFLDFMHPNADCMARLEKAPDRSGLGKLDGSMAVSATRLKAAAK